MSKYDETYFLRGKEAGVSLYTDYRWIPELTRPMVRAIIDHLQLSTNHSVLDFGCARGYIVRALREFGYTAFGYDEAAWPINNADPFAREYVTNIPVLDTLLDVPRVTAKFDWIIAKDVLEHVPMVADVINELMTNARVGVFVIVPLAAGFDKLSYAVPEYEKDVTHIHRLTLASWARMFMWPGWTVEARYRIKGVKDNYQQYPNGNGFITCRRLA